MEPKDRGEDGKFLPGNSGQEGVRARKAKPKGKQNSKTELINVPGAWAERAVDTLGRSTTPKEREAQVAYAITKLEETVDLVFTAAQEILQKPGSRNDGPRVQLIGKFLDKLLPDLIANGKGPMGGTTKIVFGVPLNRLAATGGIAAAVEITQNGDHSE